jgi:DMSO/TMAO reductase YedYZ molybdopterin-dependent catalytic subunit/thiosulfate reductase cytochrome b subunit
MHYGFPLWLVLTHFLNILFLTLLARSGVGILSAFPKLYLSDHCHPGREFIRFSKRTFSADSARPWSSLEEEESWSPVLALPGRKNLGLARHWHFMTIQFWILTGLAYVILLFVDDQWRRLVPTDWAIVPDAFRVLATYLSGHLAPPQPGLPYNAAQQLAYFAVVFVLAPLQILTGAAMSPSVIGRFPRYPRLFGGRQVARSLHFLTLCALVAFVVVHTAMVVIHGIPREFAAIVLTSYGASHTWAVVVGAAGLLVIAGVNVLATAFSLRHRRRTQRLLGRMVDPFERVLSRASTSRQRFRTTDVSSYFRVNGYPPPDERYRQLAADGFAEYRLEVGGLVEQPLRLSLDELRGLGWGTQTTKHNCIQGWSAIAEWGGVPLAAILEACRPLPEARHLVFLALDDKTVTENEGRHGYLYGTIPLFLALKPQSILALEMNGRPLPVEHGAPARVRIETQLGFKMVKWVHAIQIVDSYAAIGQGQGGWREDQQFYANAAGI